MVHPHIDGHLTLDPMLLCLLRAVVGRMRDEHFPPDWTITLYFLLVLPNFHRDSFFLSFSIS